MFGNVSFYNERGCTTIGGKVDFCSEAKRNNSEKLCFLCETDTCNEASDMKIIRCLMFILAIMIVLYMRKQMEMDHLRDRETLRW